MKSTSPCPHVVIIILSWNRCSLTTDCIRSVMQLKYPNYSIVVVDNNSSDDTVEKLRIEFQDGIKIIQNKQNLGYAQGNNVGIRYAINELSADFVALLNNDTIVHEDWLQPLVNVFLTDNQVGATGSLVYYFDEQQTIWFAGGSFGGWRGIPGHIGQGCKDTGQFIENVPADYVSGSAMLMKRETWEVVGELNPDYFVYFEEADWCARAKRAGFKILLVPESKIWHRVGASSGLVEAPLHTYYMVRNNFLFLKNNTFPWLRRSLKLALYIIIIAKRYTPRLISGDYKTRMVGITAFQALWSAILGRFGPSKQLTDANQETG